MTAERTIQSRIGGVRLQHYNAVKSDGVATKSIALLNMQQRWRLIDDLLGGTLVMRAARTLWLPQERGEEEPSYDARLQRSVLFGALRDTIQKVVSKPYSRPVTWEAEDVLPDLLRSVLWDADRDGSDITEWSRGVFHEAVKRGLTHVLVDFPQTGGMMNLAEERQADIRPYFVHITPDRLLGFKWERKSNGEPMLTQIRISETRVEPDGDYGELQVDYVRVINSPVNVEGEGTQPGTWELWRKPPEAKDDEFVLVEEGTHTFPGIPLVTVYLHRTGFMEATPPFEDLADLNLLHWQSNSDQSNLTHFARVPILARLGFSEQELKKPLLVGGGKGIGSTNENAKVLYVEHSGAAIKSGMEALRHIEEMMEVLGLQPFIANLGNQTATARGIDESKTQSLIQSWIRAMENFLTECMVTAVEWSSVDDGQTLRDSDFAFNIFSDFGLSMRANEDIDALIKMRTTVPPQIDHETFLTEIRRRGTLSDSVDVRDIMDRVEAESEPPTPQDPGFTSDDDQNTDEPSKDGDGMSADG